MGLVVVDTLEVRERPDEEGRHAENNEKDGDAVAELRQPWRRLLVAVAVPRSVESEVCDNCNGDGCQRDAELHPRESRPLRHKDIPGLARGVIDH